MSLVRQPLSLALLLQAAADSLRPAAEEAKIDLILDLPTRLEQPQGDKVQIERVMANLLENAVSYTPTSGQVIVKAAALGDEVMVSVTDTGPGIPPEHRKTIFERFTRVPGTSGRRRGFGLGLYFCRQVVEAHGGRIWVEPGPGDVGSRFVFRLPI